LWSAHVLVNLRNLRPDARKGDKHFPRFLANLKPNPYNRALKHRRLSDIAEDE
jgi:hypothetical protein